MIGVWEIREWGLGWGVGLEFVGSQRVVQMSVMRGTRIGGSGFLKALSLDIFHVIKFGFYIGKSTSTLIPAEHNLELLPFYHRYPAFIFLSSSRNRDNTSHTGPMWPRPLLARSLQGHF